MSKSRWQPNKFLRRGEYDLVNISLIGRDPISGMTFEQCHDAFDAELKRAIEMERGLRWWKIIKQLRYRFLVAALVQRQGMGF